MSCRRPCLAVSSSGLPALTPRHGPALFHHLDEPPSPSKSERACSLRTAKRVSILLQVVSLKHCKTLSEQAHWFRNLCGSVSAFLRARYVPPGAIKYALTAWQRNTRVSLRSVQGRSLVRAMFRPSPSSRRVRSQLFMYPWVAHAMIAAKEAVEPTCTMAMCRSTGKNTP